VNNSGAAAPASCTMSLMPVHRTRPPIPRGAAVRTSDASVFDTTRAKLRTRMVDHPFTGVSAIDLDIGSVIDTCRAYEPLLRVGEAFSHLTAAQLYGVPLPESQSAVVPVHVLSPTSTRARTVGTVGHRAARPFPFSFRYGLPVVGPELVWLQLAAILSRNDLVAAGDHLVTPGGSASDRAPSLASIRGLRAMVDSAGQRRGVRNAAWAITRVRVGPASRPETLLRLCLVEGGFPEPEIGVPVPVAGGSLVLHPDLAYPTLRIAIEYEGGRHREARRWERDIERRELFEDAGWRVIRVTAASLADPIALVARVRRVIEARAGGSR
jgi:hypothetical protein